MVMTFDTAPPKNYGPAVRYGPLEDTEIFMLLAHGKIVA